MAGRSRSLAQDMVIWDKGRYTGEDEKTIKYFTQVGVLRMSMFSGDIFFYPCTMFFTKGLLPIV